MKYIVCFHLYNDYSGSPKVLHMVLKGILHRGHRVDLITSHGGVLDDLEQYPGLKIHHYRYSFMGNAVTTMLRYTAVQLYTFFFAFRYLFCKDCVFYINTLLPVGPALAGRIMGKRVIYHYHENAFVKGAFYKVLAWMMQRLAHRIICVSTYQASFLKRKEGVEVVPNALPQDFVNRLYPNKKDAFEHKSILMLSSLKEYKGTREFIELARRLSQFKFTIIINDTQENIDKYVRQIIPAGLRNLMVYPRQIDVSRFYNESSLVINLTNSKFAIETFGLTALEAMTAGLPVIVPTVGGIAEMVEDGKNGFKIDVQALDKISDCIEAVLSDEKTFFHLATEAFEYSKKFSEKEMIDRIANLLYK